MSTDNTIAALARKLNAAKAELQKERANKDRVLRPFAHKGLDDFFDFPDEYHECISRIRDIMDYASNCQKAIDLLNEIEGSKFTTPSEWNTKGREYILSAYDRMDYPVKERFYNRFSEWFNPYQR